MDLFAAKLKIIWIRWCNRIESIASSKIDFIISLLLDSFSQNVPKAASIAQTQKMPENYIWTVYVK